MGTSSVRNTLLWFFRHSMHIIQNLQIFQKKKKNPKTPPPKYFFPHKNTKKQIKYQYIKQNLWTPPAGVFRWGLISILCSFETMTNLTAPKTTIINLTTQKNMFWNNFFFCSLPLNIYLHWTYIKITPFIHIQVCFVTETVLKMDFFF